MTIRTKLILVLLSLAGVLLANGVTAFLMGAAQQSMLRHANAHTKSLIADFAPMKTTVRDLQVDVIQVQQFLTDAAATHNEDSFEDAAKYRADFSRQAAALKNELNKIEMPGEGGLPGQEAQIAKIRAILKELEGSFEAFNETGIAMARAYISRGIDAGNELMEKFDPQAAKLFSQLGEILTETKGFMDQQSQAVVEAVDAAEQQSNVLTEAVTAGVILGFVFVGGAFIFVMRGINRPLTHLIGLMNRLSKGDLSIEITGTSRPDEIGQMARAVQIFKDNSLGLKRADAEAGRLRMDADKSRIESEAFKLEEQRKQTGVVTSLAEGLAALAAGKLMMRIVHPFAPEYEALRLDFNATAESLEIVMRTIEAASSGIRTGANEIAEACEDLSKRTEEQAAKLEETASALDEITATVKTTSNGASHARDVVNAAKSSAEHSGDVVSRAVSAMHDIETSSQQIGQIIGVIDEIAFQTNLLALNAGVEAARAGEAGRGFAVVASEVRGLAQRSAEAAKEIKALISASNIQVNEGVCLVEETGRALDQIVSQVAEIDGIVSAISASAHEQAVGLEQVNTAVGQMDRVTQQNAAMAEQSTAASHGLANQTHELGQLIARFDLSAQSSGGRDVNGDLSSKRARSATTVTALKVTGRGGAAFAPERVTNK